jgi:hypothetical protein
MAKIIVKTEGIGIQALELRMGVNRIGRDPECEFQIDHSTISSLHCELALSNDGVYLRDCESTNGTFLNGDPIQEAWLQPGQDLRLGDVEFFIENTEALIAIPELKPTEVAPPKAIEINGELYCGEHPDRKVTFKCTHCSLVMCNACVHIMKRHGGQPLYLCRLCSHKCERIEVLEPEKKKGLFGSLQETVRLKIKQAFERPPAPRR